MASLKTAARRFVRAALPILDAKLAGYQADEGRMLWQSRGATMFVLAPEHVPAMEVCLQHEARDVQSFPHAGTLTKALLEDTRVGPLLGHLVGSPTSGWLVEERRLAGTLLWNVARKEGRLVFREESFSEAYAEWLSRIISKTAEVKILTPLEPMNLAGEVQLEPGLKITQLDDDEVSTCLLMGAVQATFASSGMALVANRAGVRMTMRVPQGNYDDFSDAERQKALESESDAAALADEVAQCLQIFKSGRVAAYGRVKLFPEGGQQGGPLGPARIPGPL
jgi:hypothetical protein